MAKYRKLGRTSNQRKALLRNQVTQLLYHGKIRTTEAKAKEIRKIAEGLIALGVKEKDNFEVVKVQAKVAKKDAEGKRVKEVVDGKKVTVYETVEKEIKAGLEGLAGQIPGLLEIHVNINGLESSNADLMLDSTFTDEAALKGYSVHPAHVAVANGKVRPHTAIRSCLDFTV